MANNTFTYPIIALVALVAIVGLVGVLLGVPNVSLTGHDALVGEAARLKTSASTGSLWAVENPCVQDSTGTCDTTIHWQSKGLTTPKVQVMMHDNRGNMYIFACQRSNVESSWATKGGMIKDWPRTFTLHAATGCTDRDRTSELARIVVTSERAPNPPQQTDQELLNSFLLANGIRASQLENYEFNAQQQLIELKIKNINIEDWSTIPELVHLETLWVYGTQGQQITVAPFQSIADLTELRSLRIENTGISGDISEIITSQTQLQYVNLNGNSLTGSLDMLESNFALREIHLYGNHLTGNLNPVTQMSSLEILDITGNSIGGPLEDLSGRTSLRKLYLSGNAFSGTLEPLSGLTNLVHLTATSMGLTGTLEPLSGMHQLQTLYLYENELSGDLSALSGKNIRYLGLQQNNFNGEIAYLNSNELLLIQIADNELSGALPNAISSKLSTLQNSDISGNNLDLTAAEIAACNGNPGIVCEPQGAHGGSDTSLMQQFRDDNSAGSFTINPTYNDHGDVVELEVRGTSNVPLKWSTIPQMTKLWKLTLEGLSDSSLITIEDEVPDLSGLSRLQYLNIENAMFRGDVNFMEDLPAVSRVSLFRTRISGTPSSTVFERMMQMAIVNLKYNCLELTQLQKDLCDSHGRCIYNPQQNPAYC